MLKCYSCKHNDKMTRYKDNRNLSNVNKMYMVTCFNVTLTVDPALDLYPLGCYISEVNYKKNMKRKNYYITKAQINYYLGL